MSEYDKDYFIVLEKERPFFPTLSPTEETLDRPFGLQPLVRGKPLMFVDGFRDKHLKDGVQEQIEDVLFCASNIIVKDRIKDRLSALDIADLELFPAVYIGNDEKWHDDFWFVNIYTRWDCWDRQNSTYRSTFKEADPDSLAKVKKYSLNSDLISSVPEKQRMLFKIGRARGQYLFCHKAIADVFLEIPSVQMFRVSDFEEGMQY